MYVIANLFCYEYLQNCHSGLDPEEKYALNHSSE